MDRFRLFAGYDFARWLSQPSVKRDGEKSRKIGVL
jgi:hypothetical protein